VVIAVKPCIKMRQVREKDAEDQTIDLSRLI